jgi:hypothetical protein
MQAAEAALAPAAAEDGSSNGGDGEAPDTASKMTPLPVLATQTLSSAL